MTVHVEFLSLFREKTGMGNVDLTVSDTRSSGKIRVGRVLEALEALFSHEHLVLLKGEEIRPGVLIFIRNGFGGLSRASSAQGLLPGRSPGIVLAAAMEGG